MLKGCDTSKYNKTIRRLALKHNPMTYRKNMPIWSHIARSTISLTELQYSYVLYTMNIFNTFGCGWNVTNTSVTAIYLKTLKSKCRNIIEPLKPIRYTSRASTLRLEAIKYAKKQTKKVNRGRTTKARILRKRDMDMRRKYHK